MQKKTPHYIVKDSIEMLPVLFDGQNKNAEFAFNIIMGKIAAFVESGAFTNADMNYYVDFAVRKYDELKFTKN